MSKRAYFVQECPTCGRGLEIRVAYLGKKVACLHCGGRFVATDPSNANDVAAGESSTKLLQRVEELLQMTASPPRRAADPRAMAELP